MPRRTQTFNNKDLSKTSRYVLTNEHIPLVIERVKTGESFTSIALSFKITVQALVQFMRRRNVRLSDYAPTKLKGSSAMSVLFCRYKAKAKKRKIEFKLTIEEFAKLVTQDCIYCGKQPNRLVKPDSILHDTTELHLNGVDRYNNDKGYEVSNCVPCCKICNIWKYTLTFEEFKSHLKLLISRLGD